MNIKKIIQTIRKDANCGGKLPLTKEIWDEWWWRDERPKPTWEEICECWDEIKSDVLAEEARETKIKEEMTTILRDMAIKSLQEKGKL